MYLFVQAGSVRLAFEGVLGDGWLGDIAIDDIDVDKSLCPRKSFPTGK